MPELSVADLKARIKAWERSFKSTNGREPTKDDVKADKDGIGGLSCH
jgi:hypothetical protein